MCEHDSLPRKTLASASALALHSPCKRSWTFPYGATPLETGHEIVPGYELSDDVRRITCWMTDDFPCTETFPLETGHEIVPEYKDVSRSLASSSPIGGRRISKYRSDFPNHLPSLPFLYTVTP